MLAFFYRINYNNKAFRNNAGVVELADALDSKSSGSDTVWVQLPPPAPKNRQVYAPIDFFI